MTKDELRHDLQEGRILNDLLCFGPGQECEIFKAKHFSPDNTVIYIPDVYLNEIPIDRPIKNVDELEDVLSQCYTGLDFIDECSGSIEMAKRLFCYCDWQHPGSAVNELNEEI